MVKVITGDEQSVIRAELEDIRAKSGGGRLEMQDVVDRAQDPSNVLHSRFEWDDMKAGNEYRLWQARQLVVQVEVYEPKVEHDVQYYYSLMSDRKQDGGGYRPIVEIMSDAEMRAEMLRTALRELETFERRYARLEELVPVFVAVAKVRQTQQS